MSRKKFIKLLKLCGFIGPYSGGKHPYLVHGSGYKVHVPNVHGNKDIPGPVIKAILNQAGIDENDFLSKK